MQQLLGGGRGAQLATAAIAMSTLRHGHQREEAVLSREESLHKQPKFPRKDTARSRDKADVLFRQNGKPACEPKTQKHP